jgi:aspartate aminotransferase
MPDVSTNPVSRAVDGIRESATLAVDIKAKALKAAGAPVIGFGAGEPDFPTPPHVVEAAVAACKDPRYHRYSPTAGLPELREAIAAKTARDSGYAVDAAQVLVTNGGKHAVYNTFLTLIDPGDEVLLPAPYWTTYPEPIAMVGGRTVFLPTDETTGFRVTIEQLDRAWTPRTKALVFVSPSNPTGAVYPREEVEAIGRWAVERRVWVVTDEIYEHLTYGEHRFTSMPAVVPDLAEQCVVLNGVAKTYAMTGWRVGWLVAPHAITRAATNLQSQSTSHVANVAQRAALAAVSGPLDCVREMRTAFARRAERIRSLLVSIEGVSCIEPQGAFYAFPNLTSALDRPLGPSGRRAGSTLELAELVLEEVNVAFVPGEAFGAPGYGRFSFALGDDDLGEGLARLADLLG